MAVLGDRDEPEERQLVGMTEVAELAEVHRPTVSNWRRRHPGFPAPAPVSDDGPQPLFYADQVAEWLMDRRIPGTNASPFTYGERFQQNIRFRALGALRGVLPGDQLVAAGVALCALWKLAGVPLGGVSEARILARRLEEEYPEFDGLLTPDIARLTPECTDLVGAIERMCEETEPAAVAERLITESDRLGAGARAAATPTGVTEVVSEIAGDVAGRTVYDPAAGAGSLLLSVVGKAAVRSVLAADLDPDALRLLQQRFLLLGIDVQITRQDSLESRQWHGADLVILDPPFTGSDQQRQATSKLFGWVRYAQGQLVPGGRAVVVLPAWALSVPTPRPDPRAGRFESLIRQWKRLLESGSVRAVVQLPRRAHSFRTGTELVLLVLGRPVESKSADVCLLSHLGRGTGGSAEAVRSWLDGSDHGLPSDIAREVSVADVLRRGSLLPVHYLTPLEDVGGLTQRLTSGTYRLTGLPILERVESPDVRVRSRGAVAHATVSDKLESGLLEIRAGHRIDAEDIGGVGEVVVIGAPELTGEAQLGGRRLTRNRLTEIRRPYLTSAGDVVVLPADPPKAYVDETGGHLVQAPAQVIKVLRAETGWMTPYLLAAVITAPRNASRVSGALVRRLDLRAVELPDLPPDEVRRIDAWLRKLASHRQAAAERVAALDELLGAIGAGVTDGALVLDDEASAPGVEGEDEMRTPGGTT